MLSFSSSSYVENYNHCTHLIRLAAHVFGLTFTDKYFIPKGRNRTVMIFIAGFKFSVMKSIKM